MKQVCQFNFPNPQAFSVIEKVLGIDIVSIDVNYALKLSNPEVVYWRYELRMNNEVRPFLSCCTPDFLFAKSHQEEVEKLAVSIVDCDDNSCVCIIAIDI